VLIIEIKKLLILLLLFQMITIFIYLSHHFITQCLDIPSTRAKEDFIKHFEYGDARSEFFFDEPEIDENRSLILKFAHYQQVGNAERISN